jgi:hypothetical protein
MEFQRFIELLIDEWDFDNICSAHNGNCLGGAKTKLRQTLRNAESTLQKISKKNSQRFACSRALPFSLYFFLLLLLLPTLSPLLSPSCGNILALSLPLLLRTRALSVASGLQVLTTRLNLEPAPASSLLQETAKGLWLLVFGPERPCRMRLTCLGFRIYGLGFVVDGENAQLDWNARAPSVRKTFDSTPNKSFVARIIKGSEEGGSVELRLLQ